MPSDALVACDVAASVSLVLMPYPRSQERRANSRNMLSAVVSAAQSNQLRQQIMAFKALSAGEIVNKNVLEEAITPPELRSLTARAPPPKVVGRGGVSRPPVNDADDGWFGKSSESVRFPPKQRGRGRGRGGRGRGRGRGYVLPASMSKLS